MLDILKGIFLGLCFVVPVMLWALFPQEMFILRDVMFDNISHAMREII